MISSALRRSLAAHSGYAGRPSLFARQLHATARRYPRKDAQDKDSLAPDSNEYSKSAGDDKSAQIDKTAFDPKKTSPEEQYASAADEGPQEKNINNPLEASPANQGISATKEQEERGVGSPKSEGTRSTPSGGGGAPKKGGGKH